MTPRILLGGDAGSVHFFRWAGFVKRTGLAVDILSYDDPGKMDPTLSYASHTVLKRSTTRLSKILSIVLDLLRVNNPSYVLANFHYLSPRWAAYVLARRGPSLVTCWGSDILVHFRAARGLARALLLGALRKATAITCDSEEVRRIVSDVTGQPEKVHLVFWGVDMDRFNVTPEVRNAARRRYGIPPEATVILSIRRATPHFQIEQILDWFGKTFRDQKVYLFLHAVPEQFPEYAARCQRRAAEIPNVVVNGRQLTAEEMRDLYALSDMDIHNPVSDATPVSIFEGIACRNLVLCREGIQSYRDLAGRYDIAFYRSLDELTAERVGRLLVDKTPVTEKNLAVLRSVHTEKQTIDVLGGILRSCIEGGER